MCCRDLDECYPLCPIARCRRPDLSFTFACGPALERKQVERAKMGSRYQLRGYSSVGRASWLAVTKVAGSSPASSDLRTWSRGAVFGPAQRLSARRPLLRSTTRRNASTTTSSNWPPAHSRSSSHARHFPIDSAVHPVVGHRLVGVGDRQDARLERESRRPTARGDSRCRPGARGGSRSTRGSRPAPQSLQQLDRDPRMAAHLEPLDVASGGRAWRGSAPGSPTCRRRAATRRGGCPRRRPPGGRARARSAPRSAPRPGSGGRCRRRASRSCARSRARGERVAPCMRRGSARRLDQFIHGSFLRPCSAESCAPQCRTRARRDSPQGKGPPCGGPLGHGKRGCTARADM